MMGHCKQKTLNEQNVGGDRISNLPDCILNHILSFLSTKDSVATCILSKRWKYLWTSVPNIDFDDSLLYSNEVNGWYPLELSRFMNFVERVLLLRDVSNMKKFRLSCRVCFSASRVHVWVSAAIRNKIEELDLCLFVEKPFVLPRCVFDCETLTVMKLEMNCVLELPSCISFPRLKTLHLCLVTLLDDYSTQKLFSSCPVLQELAMLDCEWINLKSIMVSIPTLKSLTIDDLPYFGPSDELNGCEIKVDLANLRFLRYAGHLLNEIILYNPSSLVSADIHIPIQCEKKKAIANGAVKLLRGLDNVKSLRITNDTMESLFLAENVLGQLPIFQKMTYLELSMEIGNHTSRALMDFLRCSPYLESLVFAEGLDPRMLLYEDDWIFPVPKCFLSCLKSISLHKFNGNGTEICLLIFLLKHSLVLERMNIFLSKNPYGDPEKQKEVSNKLQTLPRGSPNCAIMFF